MQQVPAAAVLRVAQRRQHIQKSLVDGIRSRGGVGGVLKPRYRLRELRAYFFHGPLDQGGQHRMDVFEPFRWPRACHDAVRIHNLVPPRNHVGQ